MDSNSYTSNNALYLWICCSIFKQWISIMTVKIKSVIEMQQYFDTCVPYHLNWLALKLYDCIWLDLILVIPRTATVVLWQGFGQVMGWDEGWNTVIRSLFYIGWDNCRYLWWDYKSVKLFCRETVKVQKYRHYILFNYPSISMKWQTFTIIMKMSH